MAYCSNCGAEISDKAVVCVKCGVSVPLRRSEDPADIATKEVASEFSRIPPRELSGWAVIAEYAGFFALLPTMVLVCLTTRHTGVPFLFLTTWGMLAILSGAVAVFGIKKTPRRHGLHSAYLGIGMGAIALLFEIIIFVTNVPCY